MSEKPDAVARVETDAATKGATIRVVETAGSARSAEEAAQAVGTHVARIVKSLVFRGRESGRAYLLLVSGANRVDEAAMGGHFGEALERPDAAFVRTATGFAIGGVSPFGASGPLVLFMDESLFEHTSVWAAAGTPRHVFEIEPAALQRATGAAIGRVG